MTFPALGDGAAANVGSGCANGANWAITIGTSSAIRVVVPPDVIPSHGLWLYRIDEKRGLLGGALSEGGNVFAWLESTLKLPPLVEAESLITALPPDGHGLTLLPFISGERSPGWHDDATMTEKGLSPPQATGLTSQWLGASGFSLYISGSSSPRENSSTAP